MPQTDLLIQIARDLATNTEATKNIEKHLSTLNGKVATQEGFTRTLKAATDLNTTALEGLVKAETTRQETKSRLRWLTIDNTFKFVFGFAIAYLLYKAGIK